MNLKRILGITAVSLFLVAGLGYHYLIGYVVSIPLDSKVTILQRKNILRQIGANVIVYKNDGQAIIVDTQLSPLASSTRRDIENLGINKPAKVIITHWHPDHSGGIPAFSIDTEVVAHINVLQKLSAPQEGIDLTRPGSHHQFAARAEVGLPNQPISDRIDLMLGDAPVSVAHYPRAHTDGDLVVFFRQSQAMAIGDLVWPGSFPFVDVHSGGSVVGLEAAIQSILDESNTGFRFIPGHGLSLTHEELLAYLKMINQTRNWVESQLDAGKSIDQVISTGLPGDWEMWASSLVPVSSWIKMIHQSRINDNETGL